MVVAVSPLYAVAASIAIAGGLIGTGMAQQGSKRIYQERSGEGRAVCCQLCNRLRIFLPERSLIFLAKCQSAIQNRVSFLS